MAHPHYDSEGNYYNISTSYVKRQNEIYKVPAAKGDSDSKASGIEIVSSFPCKNGVTYYHSFGMTENYFIFIETSLFFGSPLGVLVMKLMGWTFGDFLKFNPNMKSCLHLIERKTGKMCGSFYTEPFLCFHQVNGYETEKEIIFDICCYPDAEILKCLYLKDLRQGTTKEVVPPELRRYHLPLEKVDPNNPPAVYLEKNADGLDYDSILHKFELPRINYVENNGKDYTYAYGNVTSDVSKGLTDICKVGCHKFEIC